MLASIVHIVKGDWMSLVHALTEMDVIRAGTNIQRVTMGLEDASGGVEFKDGIPDVKSNKVLGKIWSVALEHHFRMPPYYTLVLHYLASLEGLAIVADKNFKTFEVAYPNVVDYYQKIVVLNRRKEFQWQKLSLFLRVGATRKAPLNYSPVRVNDGASLIRMMISKEAISFRQQHCKATTDALYQGMLEVIRQDISITQHSSQLRLRSGPNNRDLIVFFKIFDSVRRDPVLTLRFCWAFFYPVHDSFSFAMPSNFSLSV
ncbi:hypothetical protein AAG906_035725 [Vitis piasezkii]